MRPSTIPCGACGSQTLEKNFRGASVLVCQHCQNVTLSKSDFKVLLQGRSANSFSTEDAQLPTEATEELESPIANPMAPTELDQTQAGAIAIDEPAPGAFDLSAITPGTPIGGPARQVAAHADFAGYADEEDAFDAELAAYQEAKSQRRLMAGIGAVVVAVVLLGVGVTAAGVGLIMTAPGEEGATTQVAGTQPAPSPAVPGPEAPSPAEPAPAPTQPDPAPAQPSPAPAQPAPTRPTPQPAPAAPAPAPAPPRPTGPAALVKQGWSTFDRDPAQAEELFAQALAASPNHSDASYGYGYVLLKRGAEAEAKPHLCKALANGDAQTSREIQALLSKNALTCE